MRISGAPKGTPLRTLTLLILALAGHALVLSATQTHDQPAPGARSPRNANYWISAALDPATRTITGQATIRWRNISANPTSELQFHLYWNAWRNAESSWLRERRLGGGAAPRPEMFGSIDITTLSVGGTEGRDTNVLPALRFIAPDDGNANDRTVAAVALAAPVAPLQELVIYVEWKSKVPKPFARTGWIDNYFFIAQWFPKLGVLEDEGWNTHQFHASTEFYSDFGVYDVNLQVPDGWVVGATGCRAPVTNDPVAGCPEPINGTYHAEDVHDFAWVTAPNLLDLRRTFNHDTLGRLDVRLLLQPERSHLAERYFAITEATWHRYGTWFGPYPYGGMTVVDPAYQSLSDGMEYPMFFTGRGRYITPGNVQVPESTTAHEAGHQWWYGVVATNEFEHALLDEGINTYATARVLDEALPNNYIERRYFGGFIPWVFEGIPVRRETDGNRLPGYRPAAEQDIPNTPTYRYWPPSAAFVTYNKTALWLNTLEKMLGWPVMQRALSTYYNRWQFRHPGPDDFFQIVNEAAGQDLTWFFDQVYRSSNTFDYGVQDLSSISIGSESAPFYRTTVVAQRLGEATFPVDVVTTFRNGEKVTERWNGMDRRATWVYERTQQAASVHVDPRRVLLLDVNYTNNSRTLTPRNEEAGMKWALKWMVWLQDLMVTYSFLV